MNNIMPTSIIGNVNAIPGGQAGKSSPAGTGASFGDLIRSGAESAIDTMKQSEAVSAQAVTGDADLNDVVQSVTSAELTLQTVVALRDKMVSALQEVLRMPI